MFRNVTALSRRRFLQLTTGAAALFSRARIASAQSYPTRPIRFIVPLPPGGAADVVARLIGQWLERLDQPVIIENKPGAGTNLGVQAVVNSPPDGYTLLLVGTASAISATVYQQLPFNFLRDITPVGGLVSFPLVMEVNRSLPVVTVADFITYAKTNPGKVSMASSGVGTAPHLAGEQRAKVARLQHEHGVSVRRRCGLHCCAEDATQFDRGSRQREPLGSSRDELGLHGGQERDPCSV